MLVSKPAPAAVEGFGKTRVMGLGGCCFVVPHTIGVGSTLDLSLSLSGRVISAVAQVVYENVVDKGVEVGVEFLRVSSEDRLHIRAVVAKPGR